MFSFLHHPPAADTHALHPTHTGRVESDAVTVQNTSEQECSNCRSQLPTKPPFQCKICDFFLCADCHVSYDHPVHIQHKLNRVCNTLPRPSGAWRCNVCSRRYADAIGRYRCMPCDFNLCKECFRPKLHPLHEHQVTRMDVRHVYVSGHGQWFCDSCRNNNGPGNYYPWHCNTCQFDLCDNCVKPWTSTDHPAHSLFKTDSRITYARFKGGWGCDRCSAVFTADVNNNPYHCKECDYDLCEICMRDTGGISNNVGFDVPVPTCGFQTGDTNPRSGAFTTTESGKPIASPQEEEAVGQPGPTPEDAGECVICLLRPKTATIVHGATGHVCCCFECASRLERDGSPCPICRAPIGCVIKQFTA